MFASNNCQFFTNVNAWNAACIAIALICSLILFVQIIIKDFSVTYHGMWYTDAAIVQAALVSYFRPFWSFSVASGACHKYAITIVNKINNCVC